MALFKSQVLTQASGSVGGLTYSHARGGMYMRARSVPVNPQTQRQVNVRVALAMYSQMWLSALTQTQRDAWEVYAANVPVKNRVGDTIFLSGQNQFIRSNVPRAQATTELLLVPSLNAILDAPTTFDLPTIGITVVGSLTASTEDLVIAIGAGQSWINDEQNALLIYMGRPRNATRNFFKGPYRLAAVIRGDAGTPPSSPITIPNIGNTFPVAVGQRVKFKFAVTQQEVGAQPTGLSTNNYDETIVV